MNSTAIKFILVCALVQAGSSGCSPVIRHDGESSARDEDAGRDRADESDAEEPHAAGSAARMPVRDPVVPAAGSGGRMSDTAAPLPALEPLPSGSAGECSGALVAPEQQCLQSDRAEPNSNSAPVPLGLDPGCGYVAANLAANQDEDAYSFKSLKSDPVLVELAYGTSQSPDLEFMIVGPDNRVLRTLRSARKASREELRSIVRASAGASYTVQVADSSDTRVCQSYALRIDPHYCTDDHEDNDAIERATKLSWDADQVAATSGTLAEDDSDYFEVTTSRADPVLFTGEYKAEANTTLKVRRVVTDAAGGGVVDVVGSRETELERFEHWLPAKAKGSIFRAQLWPTGTGCAPYTVKFDAAACTDAFEDSDTVATAAALPIGKNLDATGFLGDPDYYSIASLAQGGSCLISYEVPTGRMQQLRVQVWNGAGMEVANALGGELTGSVRNLRISWADRGAATMVVRPDYGGYCQPYTIRCDPPMGQ